MLCLQVNCIIYDRFELFIFAAKRESIYWVTAPLYLTLSILVCLFSAAYDLPALLHCLWRSWHWHSITLLLALTLLDTVKLSVVPPLLLVTFNCSIAVPLLCHLALLALKLNYSATCAHNVCLCGALLVFSLNALTCSRIVGFLLTSLLHCLWCSYCFVIIGTYSI